MAEIAWQITVFLAPGPGPTGPRPRKKNFLRHTFLPKWTQKKFRPKRMKGGRVIRPFIYHRVTEWQSHRVTESQSHRVTPLPLPIRVGESFLCPFLINSPTRFARRGINKKTHSYCMAAFKKSLHVTYIKFKFSFEHYFDPKLRSNLSVADSSDGRADDCGFKGPQFKPRLLRIGNNTTLH